MRLEAILAPHRGRTIARMRAQQPLLCIQDGTDLNYSSLAQCEGLGVIGTNQTGANSRGLHLHHDREALNAALRIFLDQIERHLRARSPGAGPNARIAAVAFISEAASVQRILNHIGEPCTPPRIAPARGPPAWEGENSGTGVLDEEGFSHDPLAQPKPEFQFDQRVTW